MNVNYSGVGMTIDNDMYGSVYSIGFSTACETIIKEVSRLRNSNLKLGCVAAYEVIWSILRNAPATSTPVMPSLPGVTTQ